MYTVLNMDYSTFIYYLSKFTSSVMLNMHRVLHLISHLPTAWLSLWKHGHACVSLCVGVGVGVCVCVCVGVCMTYLAHTLFSSPPSLLLATCVVRDLELGPTSHRYQTQYTTGGERGGGQQN